MASGGAQAGAMTSAASTTVAAVTPKNAGNAESFANFDEAQFDTPIGGGKKAAP